MAEAPKIDRGGGDNGKVISVNFLVPTLLSMLLVYLKSMPAFHRKGR